jgi:transposase-like protein
LQSAGVRVLPKSGRDGEIKIHCPNCGYENRNTIAWSRGRVTMQCASCRRKFYFRKSKARRALDKALDAVKEALRRF